MTAGYDRSFSGGSVDADAFARLVDSLPTAESVGSLEARFRDVGAAEELMASADVWSDVRVLWWVGWGMLWCCLISR